MMLYLLNRTLNWRTGNTDHDGFPTDQRSKEEAQKVKDLPVFAQRAVLGSPRIQQVTPAFSCRNM
jgi:hypothetical protein